MVIPTSCLLVLCLLSPPPDHMSESLLALRLQQGKRKEKETISLYYDVIVMSFNELNSIW